MKLCSEVLVWLSFSISDLHSSHCSSSLSTLCLRLINLQSFRREIDFLIVCKLCFEEAKHQPIWWSINPKSRPKWRPIAKCFFFSLTQHWIMKRMADITTRWWAFGPTSALCSTFLSHKGPLSFSSPPDRTNKIDHLKHNLSNSLGCFYSIPSTE